MSWHYLQEREVVSWAESSLGGAPDALLSLMPMRGGFFLPDNGTECLNRFPSGTMSLPLTENHGKEQSTLLPEVSPVRTLVQPEKEKDLPGNGQGSGPRWQESLAKWDPDSCSWRIPHSLFPGDWDEFSGTFPKWGTMQNGELSERTTPEHLTEETGSGFWPTPRRLDFKGASNPLVAVKCLERGYSPNLPEQVAMMQAKLWSTPYVAEDGSGLFSPPTATMTDSALDAEMIFRIADVPDQQWTNANIGKSKESSTQGQKSGLLNPDWVEWLMGWPIGWTESSALETDRFQQWCGLHGRP